MTMKSIERFSLFPCCLASCFLLSARAMSRLRAGIPYLHAHSDLRAARAHLERHDNGELCHEEEEKEAIRTIDGVINEIKKASIEQYPGLDDGKDLNVKRATPSPKASSSALFSTSTKRFTR